jgi:hypothetical protein
MDVEHRIGEKEGDESNENSRRAGKEKRTAKRRRHEGRKIREHLGSEINPDNPEKDSAEKKD